MLISLSFTKLLFWILGCIFVGVIGAKVVEMVGYKEISKGIITLTTILTFGSIIYVVYQLSYTIIDVFTLNR